MTRDSLKEYLLHVVELEQKKYELHLLLNSMNRKISEYSNQSIQCEKRPRYLKAEHRVDIREFIGYCLGFWFATIFCFTIVGIVASFISEILALIVLVLLIFTLFLCLVAAFKASDHGVSKEHAEKWNAKHQKEIEIENKKIQKQNEIVKINKEKRLPVYRREYEILYQEYNRIQYTLKKLYDMNIIFPKYRSLIPVCSFFEYISSGRCDGLEGKEGAYNVYEMELRQNIVVGKLDNIIGRIDVIKSNQYILYIKLDEVEKNVFMMCKSLSEETDTIENNNNIISYNKELIAKNTELIKWFNVFAG